MLLEKPKLLNTLSTEEQQLIHSCIEGNESAQRQLYQRYVQAMYNRVIRMLGRPADAEDVVQEVFIKVFSHLRSFKGNSTLGAWIKRIAINTTLNFIKREKKLKMSSLEDDMPLIAYEAPEASPQWSMAAIHEAVKELPQGCRLVFTLYLLEGYQHQEIAQLLDISESTSKSQYWRAKLLMQKALLKSKKKD